MKDLNRTRNRTSRLLTALCVVGLLVTAPLFGKTHTTLTPGDHHLLRVEEVRSHPHHAPTSLEWTLVGERGRKLQGMVPGTDGPEFDAYPSLFNDVDTGAPILVWSRHNGVDYDVAFTRFDGESWISPITLVGTDRDEIQPRAYSVAGGEFHLVWNWPAQDGSFLYGKFDADSGVAIIEQEQIIAQIGPRADDDYVSNPEGGLDDPGSGRSGGGGTFKCEQGERCPCDFTGGCDDNNLLEGATVCSEISLVVDSGRNACILTRTEDGWSLGTCQAARGGRGARELLQSLDNLQNTSCP
jgi:hypothetical protein